MGDRTGGEEVAYFLDPNNASVSLCSTKALPKIPCYRPRKLGPVGAKNLNSSLHSQGPVQYGSGPAPQKRFHPTVSTAYPSHPKNPERLQVPSHLQSEVLKA